MPSVNRLSLLLILSALAALAACGGGGNHVNPTPPPSGGFTPSDLNGTYVFSTSGTDSSSNNDQLAMVGTFAANGSGGITGGTVDLNDTGFSAPVTGLAIKGGSYILTSDGRVQVSLSTASATPFGSSSIVLDLVLTSKSHGSVTEFDANGSGSGTLDLQSSVTQAQLAGSFAFNLSGIGPSGSLATVGSFTLDSSGNITAGAGVQDFNSAGVFTSFPLSGNVTVGGPGTATLTTTGALGSLGFDIYAVDSTHLKFIETSGGAFVSGDAFSQQGAALPTTASIFAFTMSGGVSGPLAVGGLLGVDGSGTVSGGGVDINNGGTVTSSSITGGTYAASGVGGRTLFNVSGFSVATQFVAYPTTSAGLQVLESDSLGLLDGAAFAQTTPVPSLQASQGYAMGLSAFNLSNGVEEDDIAEFSTTSSAFSGIIDINDQGSTTPDQQFSGNYTLDSPATGRGELTISSNSGVNGVFYAVDSSILLFLETDSNQVGTGIFEMQSGGAQAAIASQHALVVPRPVLHGNRRQHSK